MGIDTVAAIVNDLVTVGARPWSLVLIGPREQQLVLPKNKFCELVMGWKKGVYWQELSMEVAKHQHKMEL